MKVGTSWWIEGKINADYFEKTNLIVSFEASPTNSTGFYVTYQKYCVKSSLLFFNIY